MESKGRDTDLAVKGDQTVEQLGHVGKLQQCIWKLWLVIFRSHTLPAVSAWQIHTVVPPADCTFGVWTAAAAVGVLELLEQPSVKKRCLATITTTTTTHTQRRQRGFHIVLSAGRKMLQRKYDHVQYVFVFSVCLCRLIEFRPLCATLTPDWAVFVDQR